MKLKSDPRHQHRIDKMQSLFSYSFQQTNTKLIEDIIPRLPEIDDLIIKAAPEWPLSQINKADLAIIRLGTFELIATETPKKVVIDEAVEIAKEYGSDNSSKFVNGCLGTILNNINKP